jgi:hypothetical protein
MTNKSIISLISVCLVSMFYVGSASAKATSTYLNVKMPKECGQWHVSPRVPQHYCTHRREQIYRTFNEYVRCDGQCRVRRGSWHGLGGSADLECDSTGAVGRAMVELRTAKCGHIVFYARGRGTLVSNLQDTEHKSFILEGDAKAVNVKQGRWESQRTHRYVVSKP